MGAPEVLREVLDPGLGQVLLQLEPCTSLFQNFMKPKRTPVTLSTRLLRTRLAMSIFFSPTQFTAEQKPIVTRGALAARALLSQCSTSKDFVLREPCPLAVAVFDRPAALDLLLRRSKDANPDTVAQAAQSLVQLGDARGIPTLIENLMASESGRRFLSFETLKHFTQEDIGFNPDAPLPARREAYLKWRQGWQDQKGNFNVNLRAARIDGDIRM